MNINDYSSNDYDIYLQSLKKVKRYEMKETMHNLFKIGDKIYGYCNGWFGRDDYEDKKCVYVSALYAVFEYDDGSATTLNYGDQLIIEYINEWKDPNSAYFEPEEV
jgi:hypothetical protein